MIGVRKSASCFITAERHAEIGVEHISDGKDADRGVCKGGRVGLVTAVGDILTWRDLWSSTTSESAARS